MESKKIKVKKRIKVKKELKKELKDYSIISSTNIKG